MGRFYDFLDNLINKNNDTFAVSDHVDPEAVSLQMTEFYMNTAQDLVANIIAKCTFETYQGGGRRKAAEYYTWNVSPNPNQSAVQFKQQLVKQLLNKGEALVIEAAAGLFVAEDFTVDNSAMYPALFSNITIKAPDGSTISLNKSYTAADVLYFKLSDKNITKLLQSVEDGYTYLFVMAYRKYKKSAGRHVIVKVNRTASGNETEKEKERKALQKTYKTFLEAENGFVINPAGIDASVIQDGTKQSTNEVSNLSMIAAEAAGKVAMAYHLSPSLLTGQVQDTSKAIDQTLTFCIDPIVGLIESEINKKRYGKEVLNDNYIKIDTTHIKHVDIFAIATAVDKLISSSVYNIDEIREKIGDAPLNTEWSRQYILTKNYERIGDKNTGSSGAKKGEG